MARRAFMLLGWAIGVLLATILLTSLVDAAADVSRKNYAGGLAGWAGMIAVMVLAIATVTAASQALRRTSRVDVRGRRRAWAALIGGSLLLLPLPVGLIAVLVSYDAFH